MNITCGVEQSMDQGGAVPYRIRDGQVEFCLITTRRNGGWSFPKGFVDPGETVEIALKRETLEEAGVEGEISGDPLGTFVNTRWEKPADVVVYLLKVTSCHDQWAESDVRQRMWCDEAETLERLSKEYLREFVRTAMERLS